MKLHKDRAIDLLLDEQARGTIKNVKWTSDEKGVHFSFSVDPEAVSNVAPEISPTYRNSEDDDDLRWSYAENA